MINLFKILAIPKVLVNLNKPQTSTKYFTTNPQRRYTFKQVLENVKKSI
jgi:hypothetical protein